MENIKKILRKIPGYMPVRTLILGRRAWPISIPGKKTKSLSVGRLYIITGYHALKNRKNFANVETYCMFIGYPRSGHSIIASMLDAHPNMIISHERNALNLVLDDVFTRNQIFCFILKNSEALARQGRGYSGYSYAVPNQWQGKFDVLKVIGDKKGQKSTERLKTNLQLLEQLKKKINLRIKFIHHIRNPYDIISTMCRRKQMEKPTDEIIDFFFSLCEGVVNIKKKIEQDDIFEGRHESFIEDPKSYLRKLCQFFNIDCPDDYLKDCASIVYKSPHKSRQKIQWDKESINKVEARIDKFEHFKDYTFES